MFIVWWKRQDEWKEVCRSSSYSAAEDFALRSIVHGGITQRIEIREGSEPTGRAIYDASWGQTA